MALVDWMAADSAQTLERDHVRLRPPRMTDHRDWAALRTASRAYLQPWEPTWPDDDLTRGAFKRRLDAYRRELDQGVGFAFHVFDAGSGLLTGGIRLTNVRLGVARTGTLGYWCGQAFAGQGRTLAAVRAVCDHAFGALQLHRVEAQCVPENERSRAVLLRAGFEAEGRARDYLKIDGRWRDHLLFGRVKPGAAP